MKKFLFLILIGVVVVGIIFVAGSWWGAYLFVAPAPSVVEWRDSQPFSPEVVTFSAQDGVELKGWFFPRAGSDKAVVLLHGVHANRDAMHTRAVWLVQQGYNVLAYDARGCGESAPTLRSFGYYETRDLLGAISWLENRGMREIACVGCSQGASTILLAARQLPASVCAIVAECPYAALQDSVDNHFRNHTGLSARWAGALLVPFAEWKLGIKTEEVVPLREVEFLKAPILYIGGTKDPIAPPSGVLALYEASPGPKELWMVEGGGHGDFLAHAGAEYRKRVGAFLDEYLK